MYTSSVLFPDISRDSTISDFPRENSSTDAPTFDHSQNTRNASISFNSGKDKSLIENPLNISSTFSRNIEGEHSCFSYTPLYDSSNHEDVNEHPKFSHHYCRDPHTSSFDHIIDSLILNLSKPLVSDDLPMYKVETPQCVKEL